MKEKELKMVRLHKSLAEELYAIQAMKVLNGEKVSFGELTRQIYNSESFKLLKEELLKNKKGMTELSFNIKLDGLLR